ncbi:hypothetical protein G6F65_022202 [Rhizopus arrhizus]|nr:hypothetical protein G6F65_022202 [Rhizopus arrhizus]
MSRKCGDSVQAAHAAIWPENVADGPQGAGHEKHNYNCPGRSGRAAGRWHRHRRLHEEWRHVARFHQRRNPQCRIAPGRWQCH